MKPKISKVTTISKEPADAALRLHRAVASSPSESEVLKLLHQVWRANFIHDATFDLKQEVRPFFEAAIEWALDRGTLETVFGHAAAVRAALERHGAVPAGPASTKNWKAVLRNHGPKILADLAAHGPTAVEQAQRSQTATAEKAVASSSAATESAPAPMTNDAPVAAATAAGGKPVWPRPVDLVEAFGPPFPLSALHGWHQRFVEELGEQVQIAVDAPAMALLAALGAAAANTVELVVQRGDQHPTNIWVLVVSFPGDGKTPLLEEIRKPFDETQARLRDQARSTFARAATDRRIAQINLRQLDAQAAASDDLEERQALITQAVELRERLQRRDDNLPTLTTGDCTQLGLVSLMSENHGRIALLTDEGDQLFSRIRQHAPRGAEDVEAMLQSHSGATIERHIRRGEVRVENAALSIISTIQPGPFAKVMNISPYHSKGLMSRFLPVLPRSLRGTRKQRRAGLSSAAAADYHNVARALLSRSLSVPATLALTTEAFRLFANWGDAADKELAAGVRQPLASWIGKLRGLTGRLATILHVSIDTNGTFENAVSDDTMGRAITIAGYLLEHARVAYAHSIQSAQDEDPRRLLNWIIDSKRSEFSHAEAVASFSGRLDAREVGGCLQRLVGAKYLREVPGLKGPVGRPRRASYLVNPWLFERD